MPRIRTVKPEFWRSPDIMELTLFQRLLYIGLFNFSDDDGRGQYNPTGIAADIFIREYATSPREVIGEIEAAFQAYQDHEMVTLYCVGGRNYYQINNWNSHQKINRRTPSRIPPPDQRQQPTHGVLSEDSVRTHGGITEGSLSPHGGLTEDSLREGKGREGKGDSLNAHGTLTEHSVNRELTGKESPIPEPQSLDDLAARYADAQDRPQAFGTIDDPRCAKHKDLDRAPACWECKKAGDILKAREADAKQERLDAIANCDRCDDNGMRDTGQGLTRCNHQPHLKAIGGPY